MCIIKTKPFPSDRDGRARAIHALERSLSRTTEPALRERLAATIERMRAKEQQTNA